MGLRAIPMPKGSEADAMALNNSLKLYPVSDLPNPKATKFVDLAGKRYSTLMRYDERWFEDLYDIINVEPTLERDKVMMGALKTLGIEKGKPFDPDEKTKKAMRQAAVDGYYYTQKAINRRQCAPHRQQPCTGHTTQHLSGYDY